MSCPGPASAWGKRGILNKSGLVGGGCYLDSVTPPPPSPAGSGVAR